ncbi:hypothetical protein [Leptospira sp. mild_001]|uniref:hypothetical protein n=1 Tax=Leptospira sp. mild_001 TaxID=2838238 RepID=UPI0009E35F34|nr:hypothetical protein [Leptospira sp. mild_001]
MWVRLWYETLRDGNKFVEFVEHIDLRIPIIKNRPETLMIKSIMLPNSSCLFTEKLFIKRHIKTEYEEVQINLMDEVGCIITKACSFTNKKRTRDSFDIFLSIYQARDYGKLIKRFLKLSRENPDLLIPLVEIKEYIDNDKYLDLIFLHCENTNKVKKVISKFLKDIQISKLISNKFLRTR